MEFLVPKTLESNNKIYNTKIQFVLYNFKLVARHFTVN